MPRPYECVRRAWHSDRHHPIRGSLIQEIFRIVNEVHCLATKKNREWQEKLPIVVLKAEEIMYSKANSKAEYSDLETLWERVNEAINTIIRRDETSETGEFLHSCIEAALHLGCTPRRSSRSQRNDSPRCYLRPDNVEGGFVSHSNLSFEIYRKFAKISPLILHCPRYSTLAAKNSSPSCIKSHGCSFQARNPSHVKKTVMLPNNFVLGDDQASNSLNPWHVFPLHYGDDLEPSRASFPNPQLVDSDKIGPQLSSPAQTLDARCPSNHEEIEQQADCDLTLRLGSLVAPHANIENSCPLRVQYGNRSHLKD
ncbi:hypothetical protein SASPL_127525 [Salvia splendens]|uniref:Histone acetyltransferase n=1 Tax=Salvia splendens TaxID=180675 RepID=A0A8X8X7V2_SALSN|nr:uncharacterized protein LOC121750083 [Salvia splendens]KAG6409485.1 hypothetical protein SASPL_127525 [Salvia splendens]